MKDNKTVPVAVCFNDRIARDSRKKYPLVMLDKHSGEFNLYNGYGFAFVKVNVSGRIIKIIYFRDMSQQQHQLFMQECITHDDSCWWVGMLSCFEFCRPQSLTLAAGRNYARRLWGQMTAWDSDNDQ